MSTQNSSQEIERNHLIVDEKFFGCGSSGTFCASELLICNELLKTGWFSRALPHSTQPTVVQNRSSPPNATSKTTVPNRVLTSWSRAISLLLKSQLTVNVADTRAREEIRSARSTCQIRRVLNSLARVVARSTFPKPHKYESVCAGSRS